MVGNDSQLVDRDYIVSVFKMLFIVFGFLGIFFFRLDFC